MNQSYCRSHKKTPFKLVYDDKSYKNCILIDELFQKNIYNKEDISGTIQIQNSMKDLNDNMIFKQSKIYYYFLI